MLNLDGRGCKECVELGVGVATERDVYLGVDVTAEVGWVWLQRMELCVGVANRVCVNVNCFSALDYESDESDLSDDDDDEEEVKMIWEKSIKIAALVLFLLLAVFALDQAFAKGEGCQGDWNCSWDEYCHKPSWREGTCVEKP